MERDVKEVVGLLMRILGGGKTSPAEVEDLGFHGAGNLQAALNEAYIKLLEFAFDCDAGLNVQPLDEKRRLALEGSLNDIVRLSEQVGRE
jgi:hypothetical protein